MAIQRRTVYGKVDKPNAAWPSVVVSFRLMVGSFTADATFPVEPIHIPTDAEGDFTVDLWCDEDGLIATQYGCWLPDAPYNSGRSPAFKFDLAYGDGSDISLEALRAGSLAGSTPTTQDLLQTIVDAHAAAVETIYTETFDASGTLDVGEALRAVVLIDSTDGDVTVTLPPAADAPKCEITFKKIADDNLAIIDGDASETIDGQLVFNLEMNNQTVKIVPVGDAWYIV